MSDLMPVGLQAVFQAFLKLPRGCPLTAKTVGQDKSRFRFARSTISHSSPFIGSNRPSLFLLISGLSRITLPAKSTSRHSKALISLKRQPDR